MVYTSPIIDREILFGNPQISGAQLSPDGKYITFIKPLNGTMNIWVKPKESTFEEAYPLTDDATRPIRSYFWSRDSKYVLYVQDKGGDENFHLYAIDPTEANNNNIPTARNITDGENVRAMLLDLPRSNHNLIHVGINDRDKAWHDFYAINLTTGERKLLLKNDQQLSGVNFDLNGKIRIASRSTADGGNEYLKVTESGLEKILYANLEESLSPIKFKNDNQVYISSNVGKPDLQGLYLYDLNTGKMELIESDPLNQVDLDDVTFTKQTQELLSTVYTGDKKRVYWKNSDHESDYKFLQSKFPGAEIAITSSDETESQWIVYINDDVNPGEAYLFNRSDKKLEFLYKPRPELPTENLVKMTPIRYPSIDGLEIPGYLSMPATEEKENLPAVLFIHGGPWARDNWGYNSFAQFLANRGYAVLQINFRGSTGYGKKFLNAAINQWGEKMQDDLTAGAQYLIDKGIADPKRIAIAGGSYGGYATLAGLTFTPDVYAAGVSIVGPSNLFTLLETIPPYWESARIMFHKRMGNPETEEGRAQLKRQSPFFHADKIKAPLLVAQGDNDPRVKTSESDQIVIAMRDHNLPVSYINFPDEGHGFAKPNNNMAFLAVMEKFLSEHLGGRHQESVPDHIAEIIDKVTVDIPALVMPEIVEESLLTQPHVIPEHQMVEGKYYYLSQLSMGGKEMNFDITRTIIKGKMLSIEESSDSQMGSMRDHSTTTLDFNPISRDFQQAPMGFKYTINGNSVKGSMTMNGTEQQFDFGDNNSLLMDGASLDLYLSLLPLKKDYKTVVRVIDSMNQKVLPFQYQVIGEEECSGQMCYKCELKAMGGSGNGHLYWISMNKAPIMIKKESVMQESGGAKMTFSFLRFGPLGEEVA